MSSFQSDGVRIAYWDEGQGDPILLIHGFASNAGTNWVAIATGDFHMVALKSDGKLWLRGQNAHHQAETVFKAFARALRMAIAPDARAAGVVPSTKGTL